MEYMKQLEEQLQRLHGEIQRALARCIHMRQKNITNVADVKAELEKLHKDVNICKLVGAPVAIVGTAIAITGGVLAFFTLGVSLILTGVGGGVAALGGATAGGAEITKHFLQKSRINSVQKAINKDKEACELLQTLIQATRLVYDAIAQESHNLSHTGDINEINREVPLAASNPLTGPACNISGGAVIGSAGDICADAWNGVGIARAGGWGTFKVVDGVLDTINGVKFTALEANAALRVAMAPRFATLGTFFKVVHIGGLVAGFITLPFDIYTLVSTSIDVHKGSVSEAATELGVKLQQLQENKDQLQQLQRILQLPVEQTDSA